MARRLGAVAARGHVAPAATSVLRRILEHAPAAWVGAPSHPRQLVEDERVGGTVDDGNEQAGERVAHGDECTSEGAVRAELDAARAGAAAKQPVYLRQRGDARVGNHGAALGEGAEHGAHASRVGQHSERTGRLLDGAALHGGRAIGVEDVRGLEPAGEALEVVQRVGAAGSRVRVHEVEPEPLRQEGEWLPIAHVREGAGRELERRGHEPSIRCGAGGGNRSRRAGATLACTSSPTPFRTMTTPLATLRRVVVGSTNPVKIGAARAVLRRLAPDVEVVGHSVPSGVPDQPWGDEETIRGALARARGACAQEGAELGVGIEGGVVANEDGSVRTCAWAAVVTADGREGVGGSLAMPLPERVARLVREGMELGHAMDRVTGVHDVKRGAGAVGILTAGLVNRQEAYEVLVAYALAPLLGDAGDAMHQPAPPSGGNCVG